MRFLFLSLLFVTACACVGQSLTLGVVGGGRLTDDFTGAGTPESKRYVFGPAVEIGLPLGLSVEVDALYRREGFFHVGGGMELSDNQRGNSFEFPILLTARV